MINKKVVNHLTIVQVVVVQILVLKFHVLLVNLEVPMVFQPLRAVVIAHRVFIVILVQIKTMKIVVVVKKHIQQHGIVHLEVKFLRKSLQTSTHFVVPLKMLIVLIIKNFNVLKINVIIKVTVRRDLHVKTVHPLL